MEEIETTVLLPSPPVTDFNFDSTTNSPYVTAPSSPQPFGNYFFSAPASPTHSAAFFHRFSPPAAAAAAAVSGSGGGTPENLEPDSDFKFDSIINSGTGRPSISAAELFDDGKIKLLTPPEPPKALPEKKIRSSRSLSPMRVSDMIFEQENNPKWYKKWKIKDLLLFRSASEGSARNDKYSKLKKMEIDDTKKRIRVSAHELHYTVNRAVSEEMKKKTYLPYKRGLLGCLGFSPPLGVHHISRGFGVR